MKTILVTGSNGLLGQKLVYKLKDHPDFNLVATSVGPNRLKVTSGYKYQALDITDKNQVNQIFSMFQPDVVINTAAMTNVDACESEKEKCLQLNLHAVKYITEACEKYHSHLIHLSTDFIFDGESGPYKEEDLPNPISFYGQSKWDAEKLVMNSSCSWAILRTIIIYGVAENMSRSNIVLWAKGALEQGKPLTVVDDQFRSPTLAEDLADACIAAAEKKAEGVFHISGEETMSIIDLVYRVADFFKLDKSKITPVSSSSLNQPAKRPPRTGFIIEKAKRELGFKPHTFEEGLDVLQKQLLNN